MSRDGDFELVTLANGARAVKHLGHGEVMHPSIGPWEEARALYVAQSGVAALLSVPGAPVVLLDVGLGAGTNAAAAITCALELGAARKRDLHVVSLEMDLAPMRLAVADAAGFPFLVPLRDATHALMAHHRWSRDGITWELKLGDALAFMRNGLPLADVVFFDPFSPASNPGMWAVDALALLKTVCRQDGDGCVLFTYSAATPTRVSFLLGGFFVGDGQATGRKGTTTAAATQLHRLERPLGAAWLGRWERSSQRAPHGQAWAAWMEDAIRALPQFAHGAGAGTP